MKKLLIIAVSFCLCTTIKAQEQSSFVVNGDADKYYPVTFYDGGWYSNTATELEIGRSNVHTNSAGWGSLIAKFRFHCTIWGHGSNFIDADIRNNIKKFIAGWRDASMAMKNKKNK